MSFTRAKATNWLRGDKITPTEINTIGDNLRDAVDCATLALGTTKSMTRVVVAHPMPKTATEWVESGTYDGKIMTTVNTAARLSYAINIPHGATWTGVTLRLKGKAGHGGLPANMPTLRSVKHVISTDTDTSLDYDTDSSATTGAYETAHDVTNSFSEVIDSTTGVYTVRIISEFGANALDNMEIHGVTVTYTMTALDFGRA